MLNRWGEKSLEYINKKGLDEQIKRFLLYAETMLESCSIIDTYRTAEEQNKCYNDGASKCDGYIKKSNHQSGNAFDIIPHPSKYNATSREWIKLYSSIMISLHEFNKTENNKLKLSWGGFWNNSNNKIGWDCPHYETEE